MRLVDLALGHGRLPGAAGGLGDERERHHRGAGELVAGDLVGDVDQRLEAPLRPEHRQRGLHVDARVAGADRERVRLGGRQARLELAVDEQAPDLLERHLADEVLDVDAAIAQRAALLVGLGDLGGEGDDAFQAGLDFAHAAGLSAESRRPEHYAGARRVGSAPPHGLQRPHVHAGRRSGGPRPRRRALRARARAGQPGPDRGARREPERVRRGRRRAGAGGGGRDPAGRRAPVRGRADRDQGQRAGRGPVHELRLEVPLRATGPGTAPTSCGGCARPASSSSASPTCPSSGSCRPRSRATPGATPQPVGPRAHAGRLLRRLGGRGRRRDGAARPRQRRRRLDPHPRRLLRARRPQAEPRPHLQGPGPRRHVPRLRRRAHAHGRRDRGAARRAGGLRGRRRELGGAPGRGLLDLRPPRPRPPADRDDGRQPARGRRRPGVRARHAPGRRAAVLARPRGPGGRAAHARQGRAGAVHLRLRARRRARHLLRRAARRAPADRRRDRAALARDPRAGAADQLGRLPRRGRAAAGAGARRSSRSSPSTTCC